VTGDGAKLAAAAVVLVAGTGVIVRPFRTPEAAWAVGGAALLVALGLLPVQGAVRAVAKSLDVCLFLTGMMLLSETARREGLFDAVAAFAAGHARGSSTRLFALIYAAGVVVTVFMSNDATAVVMTPAVFAAARRAKADPLPHLLACAFVANAASFVLPISNPANLVLYADHPPPLGPWMARFALASALSICATYLVLRWRERDLLARPCAPIADPIAISGGGWATLAGLVATAAVLLTVSALNAPLGLPTALMGAAVAALVCTWRSASPLPLLRGVAWSVLALVGGLFVMVEALEHIGLIADLADALAKAEAFAPRAAAWASGAGVALASNLANNLPVGLITSAAGLKARASTRLVDALMIGVDLGPNLSVTGSLATILWLSAIRREGEHVSGWRFLKIGVLVMPPALVLALAARLTF
jgi:arsenical pump membrane protein